MVINSPVAGFSTGKRSCSFADDHRYLVTSSKLGFVLTSIVALDTVLLPTIVKSGLLAPLIGEPSSLSLWAIVDLPVVCGI
jgi:hypothetical protein